MRYFLLWLPLAVTITVLSGLAYAVGQQIYRTNADLPLVTLAETTAQVWQREVLESNSLPIKTVDISTSLESFVNVYSVDHQPIAGNGQLNGKLATPPSGVFDFAQKSPDNRLTWQPQPGVRQAIVVKYFTGPHSGYVVAGQSLKEIEKQENSLSSGILAGWAICLLLSYTTVLLTQRSLSRHV